MIDRSHDPAGDRDHHPSRRGQSGRRRSLTTVLILLTILTVGATLRLSYLAEKKDSPSFRSPRVDAAFHDYWARGLVSGDWTPPGNQHDPRVRETPFFRPPGYPYFLAMVYAVFGDAPSVPRAVQLILGLANVLLAFLLGAQWYGRAVGWIFATAMSVYWVFIFYEAELHATVLFVFLLLLMLQRIGAWYRSRRFIAALEAGFVGGLAALVRPNALAIVTAVAIWTVWVAWRRGRIPRSVLGAVAVILGCALAVLPATVRNYRVAGDLVLISSNLGVNLYIGNHERADGLVTTRIDELGAFHSCFDWPGIVENLERKQGRPLRQSEVSSYFTRNAIRFALDHPTRFLALTSRKALLFWGPQEVAHNTEVHFERRFSGVLSRIPGNFALVLALGILGFGILTFEGLRARSRGALVKGSEERARWDRSVLVVLVLAAYFLSVLPFFAAARYRVPVVPLLLLFGSVSVHHLVALLKQREFRAALLVAAGFAVLYAATTRSPTGYEPSLARWYFDQGTDYSRTGDSVQAIEHYREALRHQPDYFEAHYNLGHALKELGDVDQAMHHWAAALKLSPDSAPVHYNLALAYRDRGATSQAIGHLEAASARRPESVAYHLELANLYLATGRIGHSRDQYQQTLELEPDHLEATRNLAWILAMDPDAGSRDPSRAIQLAEKAAEQTDGSSPSVLDALAAAYAAAGRYTEAVATAERAVDLARSMGSQGLASSIQLRLETYRTKLEAGAGEP